VTNQNSEHHDSGALRKHKNYLGKEHPSQLELLTALFGFSAPAQPLYASPIHLPGTRALVQPLLQVCGIRSGDGIPVLDVGGRIGSGVSAA
jgi:hypothetical protein